MSRHAIITLLFSALLIPSVAQAEDAWILEDIEALRWPDAEQVSVVLEPGDKVTVVYKADGMVRVRKGAEFGWVPEAKLGDSDPSPAAAEDDPWAIPDMPTLDIPGLDAEPAAEPAPEAAPEAPAE